MKRTMVLLIALLLALMCATYASADAALPSVGDEKCGFTVTDVSRFELVGADLVTYVHDKTGATVMLFLNEDTNRTFQIAFRTPAENDMGVPHVFEHATLDGSEKYPSAALFFNLTAQTYNTFLNALTGSNYTCYPCASLSEEQLIKYTDYYLDSVFNPMIMTDESLFREEAWRYAMDDAEGDLRLEGTVYSEMRGAVTISSSAMRNAYKTLFPGTYMGNESGGHPAFIPDMTWDDLKVFHDKYYHPSNSLTCLYGKIDDIDGFLTLMDGYFSAYEKAEIVIGDGEYAPLEEPQVVSYEFGVEQGADTANGSDVYYGYLLGDLTAEQTTAFDLLTTLLMDSSSPYMQTMKERLPAANPTCYIETSAPEYCLMFGASGVNPEDAETFKAVVDETLALVAKEGLSASLVDAVSAANRMSTLLATESSSVGVDVATSIPYYWSSSDDIYGYMKMVEDQSLFEEYAASGMYSNVIEDCVIGNQRTALITTSPVPGLKEQQDAALAEKLAGVKAGMTEEEIAGIVATTQAAAEQIESDASEYIAQLQAVTVESLPEEIRVYDVQDEMGEDGLRRIHAEADVEGVGTAYLLLNSAGIPQEDLHWYKLYVSLLGQLDSSEHTRSELSALMTRYFHEPVFNTAIYDIEVEDSVAPYLRISWTALDEDMQAGYELLYELLFETKFDDAQRVMDFVSNAKTGLKRTITTESYNIQYYRAIASDDASSAYFNYINFLDYYDFLVNLEATFAQDPDAALAKLSSIQAYFHNRQDAVSGFAGNAESASVHREAADAFFAKLDSVAVEPVSYSFPAIPASEALVVESAVQFNLLYASYDQLGLEEFTADMSVVASVVNDMYLYPLLRDQYGAYGAWHDALENGLYMESYRDPNVAETFDVFDSIPGLLAETDIDQATLDGYILSTYSSYALSQGELSGALGAIINTVSTIPLDRNVEYMKQLKGVTAESITGYVDMYQKIVDTGIISTSGGASVIAANADRYEVVQNPFAVVDATQVAFSDVTEEHANYDAVRFSYENGYLQPVAETVFGADDAATLGDSAVSMYALLGGTGEPAEAIDYLGQFGIVPADGDPAQQITREEMVLLFNGFCQALEIDVTPAEALPELPDADQIGEGSQDAFAWAIGVGCVELSEDGSLAPQALATRAQLAQLLYSLFSE